MRKFLLSLVMVVALSLPLFGQGNAVILSFPGVPSGSCAFVIVGLNSSNGDFYTCPAGSWVLAGSGGGATLGGITFTWTNPTAYQSVVLTGATTGANANPGIPTSRTDATASVLLNCALANDANRRVVLTNSGAIAVTVPTANASCSDGRTMFTSAPSGAEVITHTPVAGTINGGATAIQLGSTLGRFDSFGTNDWEFTIAIRPDSSGRVPASLLSATPSNGTTCAVGAPHLLTGPREYFFGTTATDCYVTPPTPAAGYEFCVRTDNNVSANIHLNAIASVYYEKPDRTGYGTVNTAMATATGTKTNQICIVGRDATHYAVMSNTGDFTAP